MNILFITPEKPSFKSGGGICVYESLKVLTKEHTVDYVGPRFDENDIQININNKYFFEDKDNKFQRCIALLQGDISGYFFEWIRLKTKIDFSFYDYVHIEFSKMCKVVSDVNKINLPIQLRLHNIETDYSYNLYKLNKSIVNNIKYKIIRRIEGKILKNVSLIITLTRDDTFRLGELYNARLKEKVRVMPICVRNGSEEPKKYTNKDKTELLITGSLWYGPNCDGIDWFLCQVWPEITSFCKLTIAGSNPNNRLMERIKRDKDIVLIMNPEETSQLFRFADLYVSPIFFGAGMKVKIAESISYGLPVVGTKHSFIGYDMISENYNLYSDTKEDFIKNISNFHNKSFQEKEMISKEVLNIFQQYYSLDAATKYINKKNVL